MSLSESEAFPIVTTDWLARHMDAPDVRIVDGSWHMPGSDRDARQEYSSAHIPGAVFFDLNDIVDADSPLPHTLPGADLFSSRVRKLGLGSGNKIVCYDSAGLFSAARIWWMFRAMGHKDVVVLDGGFPKWRNEGRAVEDLAPRPRERHFIARVNRNLIRDVSQVKTASTTGVEQILDARPPPRFRGEGDEPRPGLRSGHIPGSLNIPCMSLLNEDRTYKSKDELVSLFDKAGCDLSKPTVVSCGSGVTACIVMLGLELIGKTDVSIYDGSWTDWGSHPDTEVETG